MIRKIIAAFFKWRMKRCISKIMSGASEISSMLGKKKTVVLKEFLKAINEHDKIQKVIKSTKE